MAVIDAFNDIKINRFYEDNTLEKVIDVPIVSHYNKNFAQFIRNTSRVKESLHQIPIMGLRITGMSRDTARVTQQNYIRTVYDRDRDRNLRDRRPSTWKLSFSLSLYAENLVDFSQMVENVITYFDPTITLAIKEFESVNIERDIILTLEDGVSFNFEDEVNREEIQSYSTDLKLTATVVMYPPISTSAIIKHIRKTIIADGDTVGQVQDDGFHPADINAYNKQMGEIVEVGSLPESYTVNRIVEASDNYIKVEVNPVSDNKTLLKIVPGGSTIVYVEVLVRERFNSLNATLSIGTEANPSKYMTTGENNLYFAARYAISLTTKVNDDEPVYIFLTKGSSTEGSAFVSVAWN